MSAMVGQWRATYSPGDWLVLGGPTSLVLLEPLGDDESALIDALWEHVVSAASMPDLATRLAAFKIDTMPTFAAFFWTEQGMRSLVRGDVSLVDVATGDVVATGEGIQTWTEIGLDHLSQVRVDTPQQAAAALRLPLVVGAVRAATIQLDASEGARVSSPQGFGSADSEQPAAPEGSDEAPLDGQATELMVDPFDEPPPAPLPLPEAPPTPVEPAVAQQPEPEPEREPEPAPEPEREPAEVEPNPFEELENADTQLMALPLTPPPTEPIDPTAQPSTESMIMAVVCQFGHNSPQNATLCRICGSPIAPQGPRLVPRPVLAVLRASDGTTADVDRAVLIGRAPTGDRSTTRAPRLMTVPSPGHDISRTHLEVLPDGWEVVVTDLHSTNGTTLIGPGGVGRQQLTPGTPQPVQLGSVVELGDGVSVLIDFPQ